MNRTRMIALASLVAASAVLAGCLVQAEPTPGVTVAAAPDIELMYYNGYVVYFDEYGRPYYWLGGIQYWIPPSYAYYNAYVGWYQRHRGRYWHWYRAHGQRYRTYRRQQYTRRGPRYQRRHPGPGTRRGTPRGGGGHGGRRH